MRISILPLVSGSLLLAAASSSHAAYEASLEAESSAGACGGSISCIVTQDQTIPSATNTDVAATHAGNTLPDGSYANAAVTATFGALHIYSDAYRATGSDAQSDAAATATEIVPASAITGGGLVNTFVLTGSHSNVEHVFGNSAIVQLSWQDYDAETGVRLDDGLVETSDAVPQPTFTDTVKVPAGHDVYTVTKLSSFTYSSFGVVDVADYSHTLRYYLSSIGGGADIVGLSGHDYAPPKVGGAPEPATWATMLLGVGLVGGVFRRRSSARLA